MHYSPTFDSTTVLMDLRKACVPTQRTIEFKITTLAASDNVAIAGSFTGGYAFCRTDEDSSVPHHEGIVTSDDNGITNHVALHASRSSGVPQAIFSSNDKGIRILDTSRLEFISHQQFHWPVNCTAISPDKRLRVAVGDDIRTLILDADTGETLQTLRGHTDYGFAAAWSDDGYTIATGNQDMTVRIYDARNWSAPLTVLGMDMAGARSLHFSPLGSGQPRTLLMCEPADYIHLVDAVTFETQQKIDFFGEIGGASFTPEGSEFFVANSDRCFGGMMEFEAWNGRPLKNGTMVPTPEDSHRGYRHASCDSDEDVAEWTFPRSIQARVKGGWTVDWDWNDESETKVSEVDGDVEMSGDESEYFSWGMPRPGESRRYQQRKQRRIHRERVYGNGTGAGRRSRKWRQAID
jgi:WD40 repeat protein